MEEKIYFEPVAYKYSKKSTDSAHRAKKLIGLAFGLVTIIVIIIFLLRGKTTVSGNFPAPVESHSLTCEKQGSYPKITSISSEDSEIEIVAMFNGVTELKSISLNYTLDYETEAEATAAEALSHFEFGQGLSKNSLNFTSFDNKFSILKNKLIVSLFGLPSDFVDDIRASYFMVGLKTQASLETLDDFRNAYESQGFYCTSSIDF